MFWKRMHVLLAATMASLLCVLLACPIFAFAEQTSNASARRTVRVGVADTDSGTADGDSGVTERFEKAYLQAIAEYANWNLVYVDASWSDCLEMLKTGDIDVLTDVSKTDERLGYYDFSSEPMGTEMCYMYGRGDSALRYDDFPAFNGLRVGYEEGSTILDAIGTYAQQNGFTIAPVAYDSGTSMFAALDAGEVDAVVQTNFYDTPTGHSILAKCAPSPVYIVTSKADPTLISELNAAMTSLFNFNATFNTDIYDYYFGDTETLSVGYTQEESEYLATCPTVDFYYEDNWEPFEYAHNGQAEGISPDVIRAIGEDTGINFRFVSSSSTQAVYDSAGGVVTDTVMAVSYDYAWADAHDLLVTQPYISGSVMRVSKSGTSTPRTVAVVQGGYLGNQVAQKYPDLQPMGFSTFGECMDAVARGDADCVFLNNYQASDYRSLSAYEDLTYLPDGKITQSISLGVTKESNPMLFRVLSKSLQHLSSGSLQGILNKDSSRTESVTPQMLLRRYPVQMGFALVLVCAAIAVIISLLVSSSARKRSSRELLAAKQEAEAANAAKSEFLSRMSHDIRTPLNGIIGMTYLTEKMDLPAEARENLEKIDTSSRFLLSLINDVLDMSKAESGNIELHLEPYPYEEFDAYINAVIRPLCEEKEQHLELIAEDRQKERVPLVDKLRASQVAFNVLSNAVKYTPEGGTIVYRIEERMLADERIALDHEIADTGIGMSAEFQGHLFDAFSQENRNDSSEMRGSGLGLAIVKKLVDAMGGTIEVESEVGKGTTFRMHYVFDTVPALELKGSRQVAEDDAEVFRDLLAGKRILLCEDHPLNQEIARSLLEAKGVTVDIAEDGKVGIETFTRSPVGFYDAILMDIRMPVMDGHEATHIIRGLDRPDAATVPIIAMTADAYSEDVQKCLDEGMDGHVAKPIEPSVMYETLGKAMERAGEKTEE